MTLTRARREVIVSVVISPSPVNVQVATLDVFVLNVSTAFFLLSTVMYTLSFPTYLPTRSPPVQFFPTSPVLSHLSSSSPPVQLFPTYPSLPFLYLSIPSLSTTLSLSTNWSMTTSFACVCGQQASFPEKLSRERSLVYTGLKIFVVIHRCLPRDITLDIYLK